MVKTLYRIQAALGISNGEIQMVGATVTGHYVVMLIAANLYLVFSDPLY